MDGGERQIGMDDSIIFVKTLDNMLYVTIMSSYDYSRDVQQVDAAVSPKQ
jgi:hypothetical protein